MKLTDIFKFKLFERTDPVDMKTVNENFESVEKLFKGLDQVDNTSDCDKNVASAKKAECDGNGKNISETYLKKTAVANNNTTTEAGYALDARQANPNVAGSLGEKVNSLANTVSNIGTLYTVSNSSITVGTSNTLLTSKYLPAGTYVVVGEFYIPSGYSGELNCVLTTASAAGSAFATTRIHKSSTSGSVRIQTTGVIKLGTTTNVCVAGKTTTSVSGCEGVLRAIRIK